MIAINDAFHLDNAIYVILRKYLRGKEYYVDILDLFHEVRLFIYKYKRRKQLEIIVQVFEQFLFGSLADFFILIWTDLFAVCS